MNVCPYSDIPWNCELCPEDECTLYFCKKMNKECSLKPQCDINLMKAKGCFINQKQQELFSEN